MDLLELKQYEHLTSRKIDGFEGPDYIGTYAVTMESQKKSSVLKVKPRFQS